MEKIECFKLEEVPSYPNRYIIVPIHDNFHLNRTEGSFGIAAARVVNLSYAQYLRFCRDVLCGELCGKDKKYPVVYLPKSAAVLQFVRLLNNQANTILWEREHPDWEEHQRLYYQMEEKKNENNS